MSSNISNNTPFLRTQRAFTPEVTSLSLEIDNTYIDIANAVNQRTIGLHALNQDVVTGEFWFLSSRSQQTLRKVYSFTSTSNIQHNIDFNSVSTFSKMLGNYTDGTNYYGLISGSNTSIAGQISFYITPSNIVFASGAGAPSLTSGIIILEWLSLL